MITEASRYYNRGIVYNRREEPDRKPEPSSVLMQEWPNAAWCTVCKCNTAVVSLTLNKNDNSHLTFVGLCQACLDQLVELHHEIKDLNPLQLLMRQSND